MSESNSQKNTENSHVRPPFPPVITAQDLIPTDVSNKVETVRIPNAFIAYRMALVRELKSKKVACHRSNVSSLASRLWAEEPEDVKNTYRKMATDAQLMHNQARGLTFLSYEQSTSTDNVMQDEPNSEINHHHPHSLSAQEIEAELLTLFNLQNLQIQTPLQQENLLPSPISSPMFTSASSIASPYDQFSNNPGNPLNGNFLGNMTGKGMYDAGRGLEHRIQILEQQISLFYQLWFGIYGMV